MPTNFWNQFSAGWTPSDDAINGRKNGLLKMTNVQLDKNGAVELANGTEVVRAIGSSSSHSIYSKFLQGVRHDYLGMTNGDIIRDGTILYSPASTFRTAFSTAFDYTLIASGLYRVKDSGTGTPVTLGIAYSPALPVITPLIYRSGILIPTISDTNNFYGTSATLLTAGSYDYLVKFQPDATDFNFVFATYSAVVTDTTILTQTNFGTTTTDGNDNDFITINPFALLAGVPDSSSLDLNKIDSIQLKMYLVAPSSITPTILDATDYYTYDWTSDLLPNGDDIRTVSGSSIILAPRRSQFTRVGSDSTKSWKTVVGYSLVIKFNSDPATEIGLDFSTRFQGGDAGQLNGNIQYAQMNVNRNNSYVGKSILGPIATGAGFVNFGAAILAAPVFDAQVNEVWIFRRDGGLSEWYRVLVIPIASIGTAQIDTYSNDDALTLGITVNLNLVQTSFGITEDIYEIIGPIEGRWYFITPSFIYPSDINNPDLANTSIGVRISGSESEAFLWAKKISEAVILVGTSIDVYIFTGTFTTLPDGTIDVFYRPLGIKYPPISRDAQSFGGTVYYFSNIGWMSVSTGGQNQLMTAPNLDSLYSGKTSYDYTPPTINGDAPNTTNYPVCIVKGKLWCVITGTGRIEVYDFIRDYWRPIEYDLGDCTNIYPTQDGQVLAYFDGDNKLRIIDCDTTKLIDGTTNQLIRVLSVVQDGELPRNRKDLETLKSRIYTNSENLLVTLITDLGSFNIGFLNSSDAGAEKILDINPVLAKCKWWQYYLSGSLSDLLMQDISIDFDPRPTPLTFIKGRNSNFSSGSKKRMRVWPFVIDTLGENVTFTPYIDNVAGDAVFFNSNDKTTLLYQAIRDYFGIDYGYTLHYDGTIPFELYESLTPEFVQILPIAKRFDQLGPTELFRYGKIQKLDVRIQAFGGTIIPYKIYFSDTLLVSGNLTVLDGLECSNTIGLPKGTAGSIFRMELGPTAFDFHRFNIRILATTSGIDTEGQWISIG